MCYCSFCKPSKTPPLLRISQTLFSVYISLIHAVKHILVSTSQLFQPSFSAHTSTIWHGSLASLSTPGFRTRIPHRRFWCAQPSCFALSMPTTLALFPTLLWNTAWIGMHDSSSSCPHLRRIDREYCRGRRSCAQPHRHHCFASSGSSFDPISLCLVTLWCSISSDKRRGCRSLRRACLESCTGLCSHSLLWCLYPTIHRFFKKIQIRLLLRIIMKSYGEARWLRTGNRILVWWSRWK